MQTASILSWTEYDGVASTLGEAIPLGNGLTGGLLWQKDGKLRLAIDRADLWDLRPVEAFKSPDHTYRFICDQVIHKKDCGPYTH